MTRLSVIVNFYNMRREGPRTLYSLCDAYQQGISSDDYEVIAVDNGSSEPLDETEVCALGPNFRYYFHQTGSPSPAEAMNTAVDMAKGHYVAGIVDGARMASPGLLAETLRALRLFQTPAVCSLSWHLGPDVQNTSMRNGYDQRAEDDLLVSVDWRSNGYRLFEISTLAPSSSGGLLGGIPVEWSWFAMPRETYQAMDGFDTAFQRPGGGRMNHDFRNRALAQPGIAPVILLGEGVFHQFHGGVTTNVSWFKSPIRRNRAEYRKIRGTDWSKDVPGAPEPHYFGRLPAVARRFLLPGED